MGRRRRIPDATATFFCGPDHQHREGIVAECFDVRGDPRDHRPRLHRADQRRRRRDGDRGRRRVAGIAVSGGPCSVERSPGRRRMGSPASPRPSSSATRRCSVYSGRWAIRSRTENRSAERSTSIWTFGAPARSRLDDPTTTPAPRPSDRGAARVSTLVSDHHRGVRVGCQSLRHAAAEKARAGALSAGPDDDRVEVTRLGDPLDGAAWIARGFDELGPTP